MIFGGVGAMMMMPTTNDASASITSFATAWSMVHDAPMNDAPADGDIDDSNRRGGGAVVTNHSNGGAMIFGGVDAMMMMMMLLRTIYASTSITFFASNYGTFRALVVCENFIP